MNENIDLTKILKGCPKGWKLYTPILGEVEFYSMKEGFNYAIVVSLQGGALETFSKEGFFFAEHTCIECLLFPSKEQRDWSKFTAPWYKNDRFDPNTLRPFDKVLAKDFDGTSYWTCNLFSHYNKNKGFCYCSSVPFSVCIPYNDDTKHLVGTTDEAPEYYRYWED